MSQSIKNFPRDLEQESRISKIASVLMWSPLPFMNSNPGWAFYLSSVSGWLINEFLEKRKKVNRGNRNIHTCPLSWSNGALSRRRASQQCATKKYATSFDAISFNPIICVGGHLWLPLRDFERNDKIFFLSTLENVWYNKRHINPC